MEPVSKHVTGAHGNDLHLVEWSQEGVLLLLLHGFGNDAHIWDDFAPAVAPYYRTVALDHRGHGDSAWDPELRYEHEAMVEDVERVCDALGIDRLVLVGHSLGGPVIAVDFGTATGKTTYGACGVKVWVFRGEVLAHDPMAQDKRLAELQSGERSGGRGDRDRDRERMAR